MNTNELIAQYLSNTLSLKVQKEFDHLMATDPEFAKEVAFQENLKTVIKKEEQTQLKKQLQSFEVNDTSSSKNYIKWFVAASIIALLAIPSIMYFGQSDLNNNQLFATNFEPYKNVVHPIIRGNDSIDLKAKAFIAYEARNYKDALNSFNAILIESDDAAISFYKANVLLQLNKTDEAIAILSNNTDIPKALKEQQLWYLSLAYIKTNANNKAESTLNELIDIGNYKKKEAGQLLKQLKL